MASDALSDVADALYALPPNEFTAARNAMVAQLRASDRELAETVKEFRKPSVAAWVVNQLARHRGDQLAEFADLGAELRQAQAELDASELARLTRERRKVVAALARESGALADELGHPVNAGVLDDVARTLQAALADAAAADAVRSGRLMRSLESVGFDAVDLDGAVAGGTPASHPTSGRSRRSAEDPEPRPPVDLEERRERKRRERAAREAAERADEAEKAHTRADRELGKLREEIEALQADRDELNARLKALSAEISEAQADLARAEKQAARAEREAADARATADTARSALSD